MIRLLSVLLFILLSSGSALADDREDCDNKSGDIAIKGCTARIRQNPRNAAAYNNRVLNTGIRAISTARLPTTPRR